MNSKTYYRLANTDFVVYVDQNDQTRCVELKNKNQVQLNIWKMFCSMLMLSMVVLIGTSHAYAPGQDKMELIVLKQDTSVATMLTTVEQTTQSSQKFTLATTKHNQNTGMVSTPSQKTIDFWFGGSYLDKDLLSSTINQVIEDLNITSPEKKGKVLKFLLEIAAIESDLGLIVKQHRGPARGIFQIIPSTFDFVLKTLKKDHPEIYQTVMTYYAPDKSKDWNRQYNVKLGAALSLTYCYMMTEWKLETKLDTRKQRAIIYKKKYNTNTHAYLIPRYISRAEKHSI